MSDTPRRVVVCSRSFSAHPVLRAELLARFPDTRFNDEGLSLAGDTLVEFMRGADAAITALETLDERVFAALPGLRVVGKYGVGVDMIDLDAMQRHGVLMGWTGGVNKQSVAELALFFMVGLLRRFDACRRLVEGCGWKQVRGRELAASTVGVVGCGHVGKQVSRLLRAYGVTVLAHDLRRFDDFYVGHGVEPVTLEDLLARADIVTLHLPLDDSTRNLLDAPRLARMKPGALLVNTARGGLVDEQAVAAMLADGRLGGVGFDVLAGEPPAPDHPLLNAPNVLLTPHIGGSTEEAVLAMGRAAIAGLSDPRPPREIVELWPVGQADAG